MDSDTTEPADRGDSFVRAVGLLCALGGVEVVDTLWHEKAYGVVVLRDEAAVRAEGDVLTIVTARGRETDIVSRAFAPGAGIDEDPVTGSAHAVLVPYWAPVLGRDRFTAFQASARGGRLGCRLDGDRVILSGRCVTVIEGGFLL
jgi:predicted PhzF superfamily epimerase YddE/YHI9